jgi:hypothetical protein
VRYVPRLIEPEGEPLVRLAAAVRRYDTQSFVVHRRRDGGTGVLALRPGVAALTVMGLPALLQRGGKRIGRKAGRTPGSRTARP